MARVRRMALGAVMIVVLLVATALIGGQMGLLTGQRPTDLGVHDGQLKPPPTTPNCVHSQVRAGYAAIDPLAVAGDAGGAMARLRSVVAAMPGAHIVDASDTYLYAEFSSRWLGFVDDVEFWFDAPAGVIQVRSASRLGRRDFGVNRARVEAIRDQLARAQSQAAR